jgi:hypothetical protein
MNKAFIDTTVLTDALIKTGEARKSALDALKIFSQTELPVFAIKEFKAGPIKNFAWMHNKLVILGSCEKALAALQRMSRTPRRYTTSTAIEALKEAAGSISKQTMGGLSKKYGETASPDRVLCDEFRLSIRTAISKAWKKRRSVTTNVVLPLLCYREIPPFEKRGLIEYEPIKCDPPWECSLAPLLRGKLDELRRMREAIKDSPKLENSRRSKTLRQIYRKPKEQVHEGVCRDLGDAIFVLFAPLDSIILTTNLDGYKPLAEALGKIVKSPQEVLG